MVVDYLFELLLALGLLGFRSDNLKGQDMVLVSAPLIKFEPSLIHTHFTEIHYHQQ